MKRYVFFIVLCAFILNSLGLTPIVQANDFVLPQPGKRVALSPALNPPVLKGLKVNPSNPMRLDFVMDPGQKGRSGATADEARRLIKYFLAALTLPEEDLWVNLSPYEKDRIVPDGFGRTEMGRDLLAEDYVLKQITASLLYPEDELGRKFWNKVYAQAAKQFGTTNIPVNTFNKVWIVPNKAVVYENPKESVAYVTESSLKVILEEDYLSKQKNLRLPGDLKSKAGGSEVIDLPAAPGEDADRKAPPRGDGWGEDKTIAKLTGPASSSMLASNIIRKNLASKDSFQISQGSSLASSILREIIIPELTREINEGQNFAKLRQVYQSLILAAWYKRKIKESILAKAYVDQKKIKGLEYQKSQAGGSEVIDLPAAPGEDADRKALPRGDGWGEDKTIAKLTGPASFNDVELIYQRYLQAFKKGAYNFIKEEIDPISKQNIPRKYFSGGADMSMIVSSALDLRRADDINLASFDVRGNFLVTVDFAPDGIVTEQEKDQTASGIETFGIRPNFNIYDAVKLRRGEDPKKAREYMLDARKFWNKNNNDAGVSFEEAIALWIENYALTPEDLHRHHEEIYEWLKDVEPIQRVMVLGQMILSHSIHLRYGGAHSENNTVDGKVGEKVYSDNEALIGKEGKKGLIHRYLIEFANLKKNNPEALEQILDGPDGLPNKLGITLKDVLLWYLILGLDPSIHADFKGEEASELRKYWGTDVNDDVMRKAVERIFDNDSLQDPTIKSVVDELVVEALGITLEQWKKKRMRSPTSFDTKRGTLLAFVGIDGFKNGDWSAFPLKRKFLFLMLEDPFLPSFNLPDEITGQSSISIADALTPNVQGTRNGALGVLNAAYHANGGDLRGLYQRIYTSMLEKFPRLATIDWSMLGKDGVGMAEDQLKLNAIRQHNTIKIGNFNALVKGWFKVVAFGAGRGEDLPNYKGMFPNEYVKVLGFERNNPGGILPEELIVNHNDEDTGLKSNSVDMVTFNMPGLNQLRNTGDGFPIQTRLAEARRILKEGGTLYIVSEKLAEDEFDADSFAKYLKEEGFEVDLNGVTFDESVEPKYPRKGLMYWRFGNKNLIMFKAIKLKDEALLTKKDKDIDLLSMVAAISGHGGPFDIGGVIQSKITANLAMPWFKYGKKGNQKSALWEAYSNIDGRVTEQYLQSVREIEELELSRHLEIPAERIQKAKSDYLDSIRNLKKEIKKIFDNLEGNNLEPDTKNRVLEATFIIDILSAIEQSLGVEQEKTVQSLDALNLPDNERFIYKIKGPENGDAQQDLDITFENKTNGERISANFKLIAIMIGRIVENAWAFDAKLRLNDPSRERLKIKIESKANKSGEVEIIVENSVGGISNGDAEKLWFLQSDQRIFEFPAYLPDEGSTDLKNYIMENKSARKPRKDFYKGGVATPFIGKLIETMGGNMRFVFDGSKVEYVISLPIHQDAAMEAGNAHAEEANKRKIYPLEARIREILNEVPDGESITFDRLRAKINADPSKKIAFPSSIISALQRIGRTPKVVGFDQWISTTRRREMVKEVLDAFAEKNKANPDKKLNIHGIFESVRKLSGGDEITLVQLIGDVKRAGIIDHPAFEKSSARPVTDKERLEEIRTYIINFTRMNARFSRNKLLTYLKENNLFPSKLLTRDQQIGSLERALNIIRQEPPFQTAIDRSFRDYASMAEKGGIDLNPQQLDLQTKIQGGANAPGITLTMDEALLTKIKNADGIEPVIVDIKPLESVAVFLGIAPAATSVL